jgi:hypothetical protein
MAKERRCSGWRKNFQSGQILHMLLPRDVHLATIDGPSRSAVPNRGRAYHDDATEHREQTEVEGATHASVAIVRRVTYETRGKHTRAKSCKLGRCRD